MRDPRAFAQLVSQHLDMQERSQSWLAQRLDVSRGTVSRWLTGERQPASPEQVVRVLDVLGIHDREKRHALLTASGYAYIDAEEPVDKIEREDKSRKASVELVIREDFQEFSEDDRERILKTVRELLEISSGEVKITRTQPG